MFMQTDIIIRQMLPTGFLEIFVRNFLQHKLDWTANIFCKKHATFISILNFDVHVLELTSFIQFLQNISKI